MLIILTLFKKNRGSLRKIRKQAKPATQYQFRIQAKVGQWLSGWTVLNVTTHSKVQCVNFFFFFCSSKTRQNLENQLLTRVFVVLNLEFDQTEGNHGKDVVFSNEGRSLEKVDGDAWAMAFATQSISSGIHYWEGTKHFERILPSRLTCMFV